jgi:predicted TIM-barrel fold metal-dependent hydrolase
MRLGRPSHWMLECLFLLGSVIGFADARPKAAHPALYDHHVHLFPPEVAELLTRRLTLDPPLRVIDANDLRRVMESDHVRGATILSTAYFFSAPGRNSADMTRKMQAVNDWTAAQAARLGDRVRAFCSFNPLADNALGELERCRKPGRFAGIKLHFANSKVDLRDSQQMAALERVFRAIDAARFPSVIHMRTERKDYGRPDAEIFIRKLLPLVRHVPVQIAHAGGWGGFDPATEAALSAFADAMATGELSQNHLYFDVSAVVRNVRNPSLDPSAPWWPDRRYERLLQDMRRIGLKRFLFGTDWPDWTPAGYLNDLAKQIPFAPGELDTIVANRAPWDAVGSRDSR